MGLGFYFMQIGPMKAILEPCKIGKMSTQFKCPRIYVLSLYNIAKSVPDPLYLVNFGFWDSSHFALSEIIILGFPSFEIGILITLTLKGLCKKYLH